MLDEASLVIDPTREKELLRILPCAPQWSSARLNWKHLHTAYYHLPSLESPEHTFSKHVISLNVGQPARLERVVENKVQGNCFATQEVLWINPAGMERSIRIVNPAQVIHLYLEPKFVSHFAQDWLDPDRVEIVPHFYPQDTLMQQIGLTLKSVMLGGTTTDALYVDAAATMLAAHLLRHYSNACITVPHLQGNSHPKLQDAIDYIHTHLEEELCITTLAQLVKVSPYYFIRLFKKLMGLTPHCYIVRQRLERAKQLLKSTDLPIAEIAYLTGFCHQSRFSTVFRQYVHVTPKMYREQR